VASCHSNQTLLAVEEWILPHAMSTPFPSGSIFPRDILSISRDGYVQHPLGDGLFKTHVPQRLRLLRRSSCRAERGDSVTVMDISLWTSVRHQSKRSPRSIIAQSDSLPVPSDLICKQDTLHTPRKRVLSPNGWIPGLAVATLEHIDEMYRIGSVGRPMMPHVLPRPWAHIVFAIGAEDKKTPQKSPAGRVLCLLLCVSDDSGCHKETEGNDSFRPECGVLCTVPADRR